MFGGGFSGGPGWGGPGFGGHGWGGPGLRRARLRRTRLGRTRLRRTRLGWTRLRRTRLGRTRLRWARFRRARVRWARKRVVIGTAALLLDGPANAEQIVQRVSEATDGALTPPQGIVELAIGHLAGRGFVTVSDGVATLTEQGTNVLAWKGISSEGIHARLAQVAKFGDVIKIRWGLFELAGLARTIVWSGTDAQKEKLAEARTKVLTAITEAKQSLHSALAES